MIDPGGSVTTVHSIPLSVGSAMTSLVKGSDDQFYVTAQWGGEFGPGTIFTIDDAGTVAILHSFAGGGAGDGEDPVGLMQSLDGRLLQAHRRRWPVFRRHRVFDRSDRGLSSRAQFQFDR